MGSISTQLQNILISFPGNLIYHLITAFSVTGALLIATRQEQRKVSMGLSIILTLRIALFIYAGMVGQGILSGISVLPLLDRGLNVISLLLIGWLWVFPNKSRLVDTSVGIVSAAVMVLLILSILMHQEAQPINPINSTWLNTVWSTVAIVIALLSVILLLWRKAGALGYGLGFFVLAAAGHALQLVLPLPNQSYEGWVRLAYLAAYPLLIALPQPRVVERILKMELTEDELYKERRKYGSEPKILDYMVSILQDPYSPDVYTHIAKVVSQVLIADLCLITAPPTMEGEISILRGFDLIRENTIGPTRLPPGHAPVLAKALRLGKPLRLPASSTSSDLNNIGLSISIVPPGHLLAATVSTQDNKPRLGLIALTPYSKRGWSREDQSNLVNIADSFSRLLHMAEQRLNMDERLKQTQEKIRELQQLEEHRKTEAVQIGDVPSSIAVTQPFLRDKEKPYAAEELIEELQQKNQQLMERLAAFDKSQEEPSDEEQAIGELRLALEEVAILRNELAIKDEQVETLKNTIASPYGEGQRFEEDEVELEENQYVATAQELRQPMSSIFSYTDILLDESHGILGVNQRRFLERIKISAQRMQTILNDLLDIGEIEDRNATIFPGPVQLTTILDEAVTDTSDQLREKNITLKVQIPDSLPQIQGDIDSLHQVFFHLLGNASSVTPKEGEIDLQAQLYIDDDQKEYALVQVTDQGGGIPPEHYSKVFSRHYQNDDVEISGVSDVPVGLAIAKTLVEAHQGRIWVESEEGQGSTFSLLLPTTPFEKDSRETEDRE